MVNVLVQLGFRGWMVQCVNLGNEMVSVCWFRVLGMVGLVC